MKSLKFALLLAVAAIMTGCAHPVMIFERLDVAAD